MTELLDELTPSGFGASSSSVSDTQSDSDREDNLCASPVAQPKTMQDMKTHLEEWARDQGSRQSGR